jgi:hypothetical protein
MGNSGTAETILKSDPYLRLLYEEYLLCREQSINTFYRKSGKGEQLVIFPYTTGFSFLPLPGGLLDQDYYVMRAFSGFIEGERRGQLRKMQR